MKPEMAIQLKDLTFIGEQLTYEDSEQQELVNQKFR